MQRHRYDVVIVGAGGAGLRAALESAPRARTAVLSKVHPSRSPTGAAQGGVAAALANAGDDDWESHARDTVKGGDYLADQDAVEVLCSEAADAVAELERMGLPFDRTPQGRIAQRRAGGHTHGDGAAPRCCYAADRTGQAFLHTLYQNCIRQRVEFFEEFHVLDLLLTDAADGARAAGVVAYELATGELHVFAATAVVLATGGFGRVFATTSNAHTATGDGMALAWRAGVPLQDMEFFGFHPTGLAGLGILASEAARGEGGVLRNGAGERFMEQYASSALDLAPHDVVARAMQREIRAGRGAGPARNHLLLDVTQLPDAQVDAKLPELVEHARTFLGLDARTEQVPVYPTAHYALGGVPTNVHTEVLRGGAVVPGLYAAGEVACVSVHGANRLGGNALADIAVFGRRAGAAAAEFAASTAPAELPPDPAAAATRMLAALRESCGSERAAAIRRDLQAAMDRDARVYRSDESLARAGRDIAALKERYASVAITDHGRRFNTDLLEAVELGFLLDLAEVLVASARARTESRGAHFREDYPDRDDAAFLRHTLAYRDPDGGIRLDYKPVTVTRYQPAERRY